MILLLDKVDALEPGFFGSKHMSAKSTKRANQSLVTIQVTATVAAHLRTLARLAGIIGETPEESLEKLVSGAIKCDLDYAETYFDDLSDRQYKQLEAIRAAQVS